MVYCRNCGNEVHGKFCTGCGTPIEDGGAGPAQESDSGSTTVIRAEDLRNLESHEVASAQPSESAPTSQTPSWSQAQPPQPTSGWSPTQGPQVDQPSTGQASQPQWGQQTNSQGNAPQWEQQPEPQAAQQQWNQQAGGQSGQQGYSQQNYNTPGGVVGGAPSMSIGDLFSAGVALVQNNLPNVAVVAVVFAVVLTVGSLIARILPIIGALIDIVVVAVAYAFADAAFILLTPEASGGAPAGDPSDVQGMFARVQPVLPALAGAIVISGILIGISVIGLVIGLFVTFAFLALVPQAVVLDRTGAFGSLGQSFRLVKAGGFGAAIAGVFMLIVALAIAGGIFSRLSIVGTFIDGIITGFILAWWMGYTTRLFAGLKAQLGEPVQSVATPVGVS